MKKQVFKQLIFSAVLVSGFILSFKAAYAHPEVKFVVATVCCANGTRTGDSNDCASGSGSCVNGSCAAGETETAAMQCN